MAELPKTTLESAEWTRRPELARLVAALGADKVRWVGGAVRDTLLGAEVRDIDAATPIEPRAVVTLLEEAGIRTIPTGIDHGTVTAILDGGNVEITTLRKDVETDGRRAAVAFASEWRDDAARRDFTINALYADPATLEVHDYFGGIADLSARRVRFIGDARQRIREDYLRILRYYRFQARFGSDLDTDAEDACAELAGGLKGLSRERVGWELQNLLALPDPAATVARMRTRGVLPVVLPEAGKHEIEALERLIQAERAAGVEPDAIRRLAALIPPVPALAETVAARLRLSRRQGGRLACAAARTPDDVQDPRALAYRSGAPCATDRLLLIGADVDLLAGWEPVRFPLKGGEIVARGVAAGPQIARVLRAVETRWIAEGFPDRARIDALLQEELAGLT
jgi:poly(A) polymerase